MRSERHPRTTRDGVPPELSPSWPTAGRRLLTIGLLVFVALGTTSCERLVRGLFGIPSDCQQEDKPFLDVATSERIFRGTWEGVMNDWPTNGETRDVILIVDATYVDETVYAITGTFHIGAEPPLDVVGEVSGGCFERYATTASAGLELGTAGIAPASSLPPNVLEADAFDGDTRIWQLGAGWLYLFPEDGDQAVVSVSAMPMDAAGEPDFGEGRSFQATRTSFP